MGEVLRRDPRPAVPHGDAGVAGAPALCLLDLVGYPGGILVTRDSERDLDHPALRRELERVREQVRDGLVELVGVEVGDDRLVGGLEAERDAEALGQRGERLRERVQERPELGAAGAQAHLPRVGLRHIEDLVDEG